MLPRQVRDAFARHASARPPLMRLVLAFADADEKNPEPLTGVVGSELSFRIRSRAMNDMERPLRPGMPLLSIAS